jgi:UDP-N-acetylmuramate--alanine ligase
MGISAGTRRVIEAGLAPQYAPVGTSPKLGGREAEDFKLVAGMRVHMVGVGGCGMCGAAAVLSRRGAQVSGSDRSTSAALDKLARLGVTVHAQQAADNVPKDCDLVVYSAAVKDSNPELAAARAQGLRVMKYSELLGLLMGEHIGVAIAGTHGKSTTTAMTAFVLREAGVDPSFVIGAEVEQLGGGSGVGDGQHFVVEACEFDRSFHHLRPAYAAILNVEEDHLDCYKDLDAILESFRTFARLVPKDGLLLANGDDRNTMRAVSGVEAPIETFGFSENVDWRAETTFAHRGCFSFRVWRKGRVLTEVTLAIPGRHNVSNALAALAIASRCGIAPDTAAIALGKFHGAGRRLTERGKVAGVTVVDDYAHHPTEIQVTLRAAREYYNPRKMFVVFQPHQHSRTRFLLKDFARSFGTADVVFVPEIYFVRDTESERELIDSKVLVGAIHMNGGDARYEPDFGKIVERLAEQVETGDLVVTMGAGNVFQVADALLAHLRRTRGENGNARA